MLSTDIFTAFDIRDRPGEFLCFDNRPRIEAETVIRGFQNLLALPVKMNKTIGLPIIHLRVQSDAAPLQSDRKSVV